MMQASARSAVLSGVGSGRNSDESKAMMQGIEAQTGIMLVLEGNAGAEEFGVEI